MDLVYLRVRRGDESGHVATYPLSAFGHIEHTSRGHVYVVVGTYLWPVAECRDTDECLALEEALINEFARVVWGPPEAALDPHIVDLSCVAAEILRALRDDEDEARDLARVDAALAAGEQSDETGYDGVRPDHTDLECRGGDA